MYKNNEMKKRKKNGKKWYSLRGVQDRLCCEFAFSALASTGVMKIFPCLIRLFVLYLLLVVLVFLFLLESL